MAGGFESSKSSDPSSPFDPMVSASPGLLGGLGGVSRGKRLPFFSAWYIFFASKDLRADSPKVEPLRSPPLK